MPDCTQPLPEPMLTYSSLEQLFCILSLKLQNQKLDFLNYCRWVYKMLCGRWYVFLAVVNSMVDAFVFHYPWCIMHKTGPWLIDFETQWTPINYSWGWRALKTPTSATPVSAVTWPRSRFNTSGLDPLGFDWKDLAASRGTAGGHSGRPPIK